MAAAQRYTGAVLKPGVLSRAFGLLAALCVALTLGACGAGSDSNSPVSLTVTRDFGVRTLLEVPDAKAPGAATVFDVLRRNATVMAVGGEVQSIDGLVRGDPEAGPPAVWSLYVNGIRSTRRPGSVDVHGGDRVWWDNHHIAADVPAVVGSYPEPFVHGSGGKRLPVRVECVDTEGEPCSVVADKLLALGVPIGRSNISRSAADETLRILVGPWKALRGRDAEADALDAGPRSSGVFARFDATGTRLQVLDEGGAVARTLRAGSGLIAAARAKDRQPVWFVTGTDHAGVASAARALDEGALSNRFALAISADLPVAVPAR